jgi:hypothetical protein
MIIADFQSTLELEAVDKDIGFSTNQYQHHKPNSYCCYIIIDLPNQYNILKFKIQDNPNQNIAKNFVTQLKKIYITYMINIFKILSQSQN